MSEDSSLEEFVGKTLEGVSQEYFNTRSFWILKWSDGTELVLMSDTDHWDVYSSIEVTDNENYEGWRSRANGEEGEY